MEELWAPWFLQDSVGIRKEDVVLENEVYKLGWFGWEDYDLWLRIAKAELRMSFLPTLLCLYRHHERAMSNTTNLFERELVAHLFEKHRVLIEK